MKRTTVVFIASALLVATLVALAALTALTALVSLAMLPMVVFADPNTTISELTGTSQNNDRQDVTVQGEVVGDILNAEAGKKWLILQDSGATISVLVDVEDAQKITHLGRYNQVGTQIEVTGDFRIDCDDHDGLTDIHATSIKVLDEGHDVTSPLDGTKLRVGALLIFIGAALVFLHWRLRERTR